MRPPQQLLDSPTFLFPDAADLKTAFGASLSEADAKEIDRLISIGLPPVVSREALSLMLGLNPGLIWSMENRTERYYNRFPLRKGKHTRNIFAPRVALKFVQKWISVHLENRYAAPDHVFGFVKGRSHVQAAGRHVKATWVYSTDIESFFPSTPIAVVFEALQAVGYNRQSAELISKLCCLDGRLPQGAPSSPVLSNLAMLQYDMQLATVATQHAARLTRYADDIVFSGEGDPPTILREIISNIFSGSPWRLSARKTELQYLPHRLKVHGLLVHGEKPRLTKGYRNRIRAYKYLLSRDRIRTEDLAKVRGHLIFAQHVSQRGASSTD